MQTYLKNPQILDKRNGKVYLSHSYMFELIEKFVKYNEIKDFETFRIFLKNKVVHKSNLSIKEVFSDFVKKETKLRSML
jgi:hypothetical protein